MRYVCPKVVKKMLQQRARTVYWKRWAAKHEYEELKEGILLEPAMALLRKKTKGDWTEKTSKRGKKIASGRTDFSTLVGRMKVSVKLVTKRKAQKNTGFTSAQSGTR